MKQKPQVNKDRSQHVHQRDKITWELSIRQRSDLTENQLILLDIIAHRDTKIVFVSGPAGSSKTFISVLSALLSLSAKRVSDIIYVRTIIESASKSLGSLPGDAGLKMEPFLIPLMDKIDEMISPSEVKRLMADERIKGIPVNYLRGASFNAQFIILDEAQNYTVKELTTAISRYGQHSKMLILGDPSQSDLSGKSGFSSFFNLFNDPESINNGIRCFSFTKEDIVRSELLKFVLHKIETAKL